MVDRAQRVRDREEMAAGRLLGNPTTKTKDPAARLRGYQSRAMGEALQMATLAELTHQGCKVYPIHTKTAMSRGRPCYVAKVPGDVYGTSPTGLSILVEAKHRSDDHGHPRRPRPSDLEDHQIEALRETHCRGGIALVSYFDHQRRVILVRAVEIVGEA